MIRTYKRKLRLTKDQSNRIVSWIGACRLVYNLGLQIKSDAYKNQGKSISVFELMRQLPELKKECAWIKDVPSQTLQSALERLEKSYKRFFKGGGFPKWASKKTYRSIHLKAVEVSENRVILPKMGSVRIFKDAPIQGRPKTAQIIIEPTGIFICIQSELPDKKADGESQAIGIDMGVAQFCILSNGTMIENPKHFARYENRLRIANRSLARKKRGGKGWKKQAKILARLHHRIANARRDFLHKTSTAIAKEHSMVFIEQLNIGNLVKSKRVSKHIMDCGWGLFSNMLQYKTNVVKVDPRYTSQTCSICGTKDANSRVSRSEFVCTNCGHASNADVNAAKIILSRGAALLRQREAVACA